MSKWSSETTVKFIQEYKSHEWEWDFKTGGYRDKHQRDAAYLKVVEAMNLPDFGVAEVKNKIKNLRSTYNQEKIKIAESKRSGTGKSLVYESSVKWLNEMEPTMYIGEKRKTFDNFPDGEDEQVDVVGEEEAGEQLSQASVGTTPTSTPSSSTKRRKTKSLINAVNDLKDLHKAINVDEDDEDCFEAFGSSVAKQLKKLSEERALLAQKAIQNILSDYGIEDIRERKRIALPSRMPDANYYPPSSSSRSSLTLYCSPSPSPQHPQFQHTSHEHDFAASYTQSLPEPFRREEPNNDSNKLASIICNTFSAFS